MRGLEAALDVRDQPLEALRRRRVSSSSSLRQRRRRRRSSSSGRDTNRGVAGKSLCFPPLLLLLPGRLELERALALVKDEGSSAAGWCPPRRRRLRRVPAAAAPAEEVFSVFFLLLSSSSSCGGRSRSRRGPAHARPGRGPQLALSGLGPPPGLCQRVQRDVEPLSELGGSLAARRRARGRHRREALVVGGEGEDPAEEAGHLGLVSRG